MATVHVPSLLRDLTAGEEQVEVDIPAGQTMTVRDLLNTLERRFPGIQERLLDPDSNDLVPHLAVFIDGDPAGLGLLAKVHGEDNVFFLAPIVGGG